MVFIWDLIYLGKFSLFLMFENNVSVEEEYQKREEEEETP